MALELKSGPLEVIGAALVISMLFLIVTDLSIRVVARAGSYFYWLPCVAARLPVA